MNRKQILCFGDSNTWGCQPGKWIDGGAQRFEFEQRWPGVLQDILGNAARVVEEGLNGRTTAWDDPTWNSRNGRAFLDVCLDSHSPLDMVIIMLGTNDLKARFNLSAFAIAEGAASLVESCQLFSPKPSQILLVSPVHLLEIEDEETRLRFEGGFAKSRELAKHYRHFAAQLECHFLDASIVAKASPDDGVHLDAENHKKLGEFIAAKAKEILQAS